MSESREQETVFELPPHVGDDFEVFVNGVPQRQGRDYERRDRALVFARPVAQEGKLGALRWISIFLGIAGTYRKHDTVDIIYTRDGERLVATGLQPKAQARS